MKEVKVLYIKKWRVVSGDRKELRRVSRFRTQKAMQDFYQFTDEAASSIFLTGSYTQGADEFTMGHTLPAQDMAEATVDLFVDIETTDGSVVVMTLTPQGAR